MIATYTSSTTNVVPLISLRFGHSSALTVHRTVIHHRTAAMLPSKEKAEKESENMLKRLKSIPLWSAVLGLIYLIFKNYLNIELAGWQEISSEIIAILTILFGIANNPTARDKF